jgi:hypothetical protein
MKNAENEEERAEGLSSLSIDAARVQQMVSMRAYELYLGRAGAPGNEVEDWLQAEAEILLLLLAEQSEPLELTPSLIATEPAPIPPVETAPKRSKRSSISKTGKPEKDASAGGPQLEKKPEKKAAKKAGNSVPKAAGKVKGASGSRAIREKGDPAQKPKRARTKASKDENRSES